MQYVVKSGHLPDAGLDTELLFENSSEIPGSVRYSLKRYRKPFNWMGEEIASLRYQYATGTPEKNHLELRYCLTGNMYCRRYQDECNQCRQHSSLNCQEKIESVDFISFIFSPVLLNQFMQSRMSSGSVCSEILSFTRTSSFSRNILICGRTRMVLDGLLNHNYSDTLENIYINAQTQMLLLFSLDCMGEKEIDTISCKFLNNDVDREKITNAREILLRHIGEPITIRQLSRKVAMNECYLKKGFKEMFGTTIFEFYQSQRMEHAKYLLYEKGLSVTEVSDLLGYSSISHFSTAFKRHTGIKPCELLLRAS